MAWKEGSMLSKWIYELVEFIYQIHEYLISLNDGFEYRFSDKELHFIVIGVLGMALVFLIHPIFLWLSKKHVMVITWIYVFTLIIVITFAIEIGQGFSKTGSMEFADIMFGVVGFMAMFAVFALIRGMIHCIVEFIREIRS